MILENPTQFALAGNATFSAWFASLSLLDQGCVCLIFLILGSIICSRIGDLFDV